MQPTTIELSANRSFYWFIGSLFFGSIISHGLNQTITSEMFGVLIFLIGGYTLSTLAHEYAHACCLRHYNYATKIELTFLGGSTKIPSQITDTQRITVSAAGPLVNFFLYLLCTVWGRVLPSPLSEWVELLAIMNLSLGTLNILPFFPFDGGHILYGLLHKQVGTARVCFAFQSTTMAFSIPMICYALVSEQIWVILCIFLAFMLEIAFFRELGLWPIQINNSKDNTYTNSCEHSK